MGHALRLREDSPYRQALAEFTRKVKKPQGHPISTWFEEVKKDLLNKEVDTNKLEKLALDRKVWRDIVSRFN